MLLGGFGATLSPPQCPVSMLLMAATPKLWLQPWRLFFAFRAFAYPKQLLNIDGYHAIIPRMKLKQSGD
nr:hypothetical protein [Tanacetum cinerariifolium]